MNLGGVPGRGADLLLSFMHQFYMAEWVLSPDVAVPVWS